MEPGETDTALAARIAHAAGELTLAIRKDFGPVARHDKRRRNELKDGADRAAHVYIVEQLALARPNDQILSEEGFDEPQRDRADRLWIVDPLDGTSEYGQGRADFAIQIALWDRAAATPERLIAAVLDLPAQGLAFTTADVFATADPDDRAHGIPLDRPVRIVCSRSRPPASVKDGGAALGKVLAQAGVSELGVEVINVGSAGAKVAELLKGNAEIYLHDSGFNEWDVAAPLAVAQHYGLVASHLNGQPVTFNHRPPWVKNLMVCIPELTEFLH